MQTTILVGWHGLAIRPLPTGSNGRVNSRRLASTCYVNLKFCKIFTHKLLSMNYGLALSIKLEKFLAQLIAEGAQDTLDEFLEDRAMNMATEEIFEESGRKWEPWCANGKSLRVGEIILIIDSDTVVPEVSTRPQSWWSEIMTLRTGLLQRCCKRDVRITRVGHHPARVWSVVPFFVVSPLY
jgi:hypothetical protein